MGGSTGKWTQTLVQGPLGDLHREGKENGGQVGSRLGPWVRKGGWVWGEGMGCLDAPALRHFGHHTRGTAQGTSRR